MNDIDKFKVLLPHWIEHNKNHETEFNKWLEIIRSNGEDEIAELLKEAVSSLMEVDAVLHRLSDKIGPLPETKTSPHGHHH